MERSYNEVKILTGQKGGHYVNLPRESVRAAGWDLSQVMYNIFKMNATTLVASQHFIPSLEKVSDHKVDKGPNTYGPNDTVRVSVGILPFRSKLAVRTTGKDDRIYVQVI